MWVGFTCGSFLQKQKKPDGLFDRCKKCHKDFLNSLKRDEEPGIYQKEKISSILREMSEVQANITDEESALCRRAGNESGLLQWIKVARGPASYALNQYRARLDFLRKTLDESITEQQKELFSEPVTFKFGTLRYAKGKVKITLNPELAVEMAGKP